MSPLSVIIPTIGIPELFENLRSIAKMKVLPSEVIVVIDVKGRKLSDLSDPIESLEEKIIQTYPKAIIEHNRHTDDWQMNNQTFNIGIERATNDFVYVTHDDVVFPADPHYFETVASTIPKLKEVTKKRVVGSVFPTYHSECAVTSPFFRYEGLTQFYSPCSSLLSKEYWEEIGRFDEEHGCWWDAYVCGCLKRDDAWLYYKPTVNLWHWMNVALRRTSHSKDWSECPLWSDCAKAYEKIFGSNVISWDSWYTRHDAFIELN